MGCITCALSNCPFGIQLLAYVGAICLYFFTCFIFWSIFKEYKDEVFNSDDSQVIVASIFWPIVLLIGVIYWIGKIVIMPLVAATKADLERVENELSSKIEEISRNSSKAVSSESKKDTSPFKVGDRVTGIKGNPDNYVHLNEGSISKVKSINEKGIMKLVLLDHKDFNEHAHKIGEVFTAPARNFVRYSENKKSNKKKTAKK